MPRCKGSAKSCLASQRPEPSSFFLVKISGSKNRERVEHEIVAGCCLMFAVAVSRSRQRGGRQRFAGKYLWHYGREKRDALEAAGSGRRAREGGHAGQQERTRRNAPEQIEVTQLSCLCRSTSACRRHPPGSVRGCGASLHRCRRNWGEPVRRGARRIGDTTLPGCLQEARPVCVQTRQVARSGVPASRSSSAAPSTQAQACGGRRARRPRSRYRTAIKDALHGRGISGLWKTDRRMLSCPRIALFGMGKPFFFAARSRCTPAPGL